jgi:hypothetical protein
VGIERDRVESFGTIDRSLREASDWYVWGPYLSERQWGTVREDYSPDGTAWEYLPHDHARSRAYRWGEDGLAGFSDVEGRLCLGLALWNGRDPILKERIFGLTGNEGNHGEDAKEYWWYIDALPSHAWNRWRYHYPQREFPYGDLVAENGRRGKDDPEYELLDTGVFDDDRYWIVEVDYAKADPHDVLITVRVTNAGDDTETIQVLPTAWYRNTWSHDSSADRPELILAGSGLVETEHPFLGSIELAAAPGPDGDPPRVVFCDNETNNERLFGSPSATSTPKDGINDHVISGADTIRADRGTKVSFWYSATIAPGATAEFRIRLRPQTAGAPGPWTDFEKVATARRAEADEFYEELTPASCSADEANVLRQALAGMLWGKQLYYFDVARWLNGDPDAPAPPPERSLGRNARWHGFESFDVMSMPDKWEYPWFAAWDLPFHCIPLARVDPTFAKYQLNLLCQDRFQHSSGALPAYEWAFDDVNPPVQAWAALAVFALDGARDADFLANVFDKLTLNFSWWVNRKDPDGSNLFEGGFLGLDNIGPIDRSHLPPGWILEQSDATGWMAFYSLAMAAIAAILYSRGRPGTHLVHTFLQHFSRISDALHNLDLWDDEDGFFYDRLRLPDGSSKPVKVRSMVGIMPLVGVIDLDEAILEAAEDVDERVAALIAARQSDVERLTEEGLIEADPDNRNMLIGVVDLDRVLRIFMRLFNEEAFLSPHGLRAVSRFHVEHPFELEVDGMRASITYEPAESTTSMFGGNSNWRGPIWFPVNYVVLAAIVRYSRFFGDRLTVEYPTGSGNHLTLEQIGDDLRRRLISIFLVGSDGRRPCYGGTEQLQTDPAWKDNILFSEYFHGDNGAGLGATHQTGWTGLVADLILQAHGKHMPTLYDVMLASREAHDAGAAARQ